MEARPSPERMVHVIAATSPLRSSTRTRLGISWVVLAFALLAFALPARASASVVRADYVVLAENGRTDVAKKLARRHGGTILKNLDLIGAFVARLKPREAAALARHRAIRSVTRDGSLIRTPRAVRPTMAAGDYDGRPETIAAMLGVDQLWARGYTGAGIDVALVDSGVATVPGLDGDNKVIYGPDLSFESQSAELRHRDTFGHGTHMAGLIVGQTRPGAARPFTGMAPGARLVSIKVADRNGVADISQVVAAITWAVENRNANGLNIRVLNLSYGTSSAISYRTDPLALAVEKAWDSGIVVVAAAGNDGFVSRADALVSPARDPFVIAVGSSDPNGTMDPADDRVASFSSRADDAVQGSIRPPDILVPGRSIVSLRVRGSEADLEVGSSQTDPDFLIGSGTSQSAAIVSGIVADLLQQDPTLTPAGVKARLMFTARELPNVSPRQQGYGVVDVTSVAADPTGAPRTLTEGFTRTSSKDVTYEPARGEGHVQIGGKVLEGERDVFGSVLGSSLNSAIKMGSSWRRGSSWNLNRWAGLQFDPKTATMPVAWATNPWSSSFFGGPWSLVQPGDMTWNGSGWTRSSWSSDGWLRSSWSRSSWSGSSWSGSSWSTADWR